MLLRLITATLFAAGIIALGTGTAQANHGKICVENKSATIFILKFSIQEKNAFRTYVQNHPFNVVGSKNCVDYAHYDKWVLVEVQGIAGTGHICQFKTENMHGDYTLTVTGTMLNTQMNCPDT